MMTTMDLRTLPDGLDATGRVNERRARVERELGIELGMIAPDGRAIGRADELNCEQMIGSVPLPVGYAGPLAVTFGSGDAARVHLPLATTEGALVASVNRGCKALSAAGGVTTESTMRGVSRSIAWRAAKGAAKAAEILREKRDEWTEIAEATSKHLKILSSEVEPREDHVFLTIDADTDEAMGMNMVTIAAQAIGDWVQEHVDGLSLVTVAANVDSDKKPSLRTYERGRGLECFARARVPSSVIEDVLKTTPEALLAVARAKLELGSEMAGAIGGNLHAANVVAALYLATGQDAAHVVEGSLADTTVEPADDGIALTVRLPAVLVGVRGGGTGLPAQAQCLRMLLAAKTGMATKIQLAETIAAAVAAGELSLLAAQSSQTLASAHTKLARPR